MADTFDDNVCASAAGDFLDLRDWVVVEVYRLRAQLRCFLQPLGDGIDRDDGIHHRQGTGNGTHSHRPTPNNHSSILLPIPIRQILKIPRGSKIPRGENIRHQNQHLLGNILRRLHERRLRQRTPNILRLPARDRVRRRAIPKKLPFGTPAGLASHTVEALPAGGVEGHDDFVADLEALDRVAFLDDLADELVAADEVGGALEVAAVEVEVAAAEGGGGHAEDGVGRFLDFGGGAVFDFDLVYTMGD